MSSEKIVQTVAKQIETDHGQKYGEAGKRREPPGVRKLVAAFCHHGSPLGIRRLNAQPQESQRRAQKDHIANVQRNLDDKDAGQIWQDFTEDDS